MALAALTASLLGQGRLRPPPGLPCTRDGLTSFTGVVTAYRRGPAELRLTVKTDDGTAEKFTWRWKKGEDAERWMLFAGERFTSARWREIEKAPGVLKPGARVTVWVCQGGAQPVLDWQAPRQ